MRNRLTVVGEILVTAASKVAVPAHIILSAWIGAAWVIQDSTRTAVPALYALRSWWPIQVTGFVILAIGLAAAVGLLTGSDTVAAVALSMNGLTFLVLAGFVAASLFQGPASYSAPAWPLYVAGCHLASVVSIAKDNERQGRR